MTTATTPLAGRYQADPVHSSFGFAVKHMGINTFRGTLADVEATYADGVLEGRAKAESISINNPPELRGLVRSEEFLDAANHPGISFRYTDLDLADDGSATVRGELTI